MSESYNASSLKALSQREHLVKRIALTFGAETGDSENPFSSQKTTAIREIIDNSVDEVLAGYGDHINVHFFRDGSVEVYDSGRGIPVDVGTDANGRKVSGIYLALGVIQSGGKFSTDGSRFSSGLNGVGGSSSTALAKRTDVTVYRNNKSYSLSFKDGVPGFFAGPSPDDSFTELSDYTYLETVKDSRPASEKKLFKTGTKIRIWLRDEVFSSKYPIDHADLIERLRGTAYLVPRLSAHVVNELNTFTDPETGRETPQEETYHFENGMLELLDAQRGSKELVCEPLSFSFETSFVEEDAAVLGKDGKIVHQDITKRVPVDIVFAWDRGYEYRIDSFVNTVKTRLGGVHNTAFEKALTKSFATKMSSMRGVLPKDITPIFDDFREGLNVVLSVKVSEPEFTSQTKAELGGKVLQNTLLKAFAKEFDNYVNSPKNSAVVRTIAEKVAEAAKGRQASVNAKLAKRKSNQLSSAAMPEKLADCDIIGEEESELLICEGDSAKGTIVKARDATYQAVLPIRGKILNVLKAKDKQILDNKEISDITKVLGAGFGKSFDIDKIRYGKILITTDADTDGSQICNLLYTVFHRLFPQIIEEGRLYQTVPPLFEVTVGTGKNQQTIYAANDSELRKVVNKLNKSGKTYKVERSKGLGEMTAESFHETVLDPENRVLHRITMNDVEAAEHALLLTMGDNSEERRTFMDDNFQVAIDSGLVEGF